MRFHAVRNRILSALVALAMMLTLWPIKIFATAPTFDGAASVTALNANYLRVTVHFSEGVYTDLASEAGTGAISKDDFTVSVAPNGGAVTSASIGHFSNSSNAAPQGGNSGFFFYLDLVGGPPSGTEIVTIRPASATAVYNIDGEAMASTAEVTVTLPDMRVEFDAGYPKAGAVQAAGSKQVQLLVKPMNEAVTAYYVVVADGAGEPNATQVMAGQDNTDAAALAADSGGAVSTGEAIFTTTPLPADATAYDAYVVLKDATENTTTPVRIDVNTPPETVTVINLAAVAGVTAPVTGAVPVTAITETGQYTGNVSWSPSVSGNFAAESAYTATITLTLKSGYILTGVAENFFTVAGATTVSNSANSSVITAVFPVTAPTTGGPSGTTVWHQRAPLPSPDFMWNVKYLNGKYMAVGEKGTLLTSTDGESWSKTDIGQKLDRLGGIAYGGGKYVLVGHVDYLAGRIFTSIDGVSWHETAAVPSHTLSDVAYGNGQFVAVGEAGKILTSTDGESWTTHTVTYPANKRTSLYSITFAAGKFVAVGGRADTGQTNRGNIMTSTDGINWEFPYSDAAYTLWDVTYGNNLFVAVGGRDTGSCFIATSGDGTTWTKVTSYLPYAQLRAVEWDGSCYIATGFTQSSIHGIAVVSTNGVSWTDHPQSGMPSINAVATNGAGRLVAMSGRGNIYTSDNNGINWSYRTLGTNKMLKDAAYNGSDLYVAVGMEGTIQTSPNGRDWTIQNSGTTENLNKVDYLNNQFVAVGKKGTILTSTDGTAWTARTSGTIRELKGLAYGGGRYVVVGGDADTNPVVLLSMDGVTWTSDSTTGIIQRSFVSVAYGDGVFIAVMQYGQAYRYQVDTDTGEFICTIIANLSGSGCYPTDIVYGGGQFTAVGGYGEIYLSSDKGTSWSLHDTDLDSYSQGIAYGGGNFVAVGELGKIMASADDGTTWFLQPSGLTLNHYAGSDQFIKLNNVTAGNNCFVAVGENGLVLQSESFTVSADADANDVDLATRALYPSHITTGGNTESAVVRDINLLTAWNEETTVSWASGKPQYIATDGTVTRPALGTGDQVVSLTATIQKGSASANKTFIVIVKEAENTDIADVSTAAAALTFDTIKAANSAQNNITSNLNLPGTGANNTRITWGSSNPTSVTNGGTVTRPPEGSADISVTLTATITKGTASQNKSFTLTVKARVNQDAQDVEAALTALDFNTIRGSNIEAGSITSSLNLPTAGANGTAISWGISQPDTIATDGTVTRPAQGAEDKTVILTATITKGTATQTKQFTVNVKAIPVASYTVTVNGSHVGTTGAGSYAQGATVVIHAGSRSGYSFAGWTSSDGLTFANASNATTSFTMPAKNVTVTATWRYNGGSSDDDDTEGSSEEPAVTPTPKAKVLDSEGNTTSTIPVLSDKNAGHATVEVNSSLLNGAFDQSEADEDDIKRIKMEIPEISGAKAYALVLPASALNAGGESRIIELNTPLGTVTLPGNMLEQALGAQIVTLTIQPGDINALNPDVQALIGNRPVIELSLMVDRQQLSWSNENSPVTVTLPYTPTPEELTNPEKIIIWFIDSSGYAVCVPDGCYDPSTGTITFTTTHFSYFAVGYNSVSFKDVSADSWYAKAVSFIAARNIASGTGNGNYSPNATLTRSEFIVMLMRAYSIAHDADPKDNFADAGNTYYSAYLATAKRLDITKGVGNNLFGPDREITRQEMFTLLYNALKAINNLPASDSGKPLSAFSDAQDIAPWAKEAMTLLTETGTISGSGGMLAPNDRTTRAQLAQILYFLLSK